MKKALAVLSALAISLMMVGGASAQDKGAAKLTIDFNGKGKKVENFDHAKHQGAMKCVECHHKDKEGDTPKPCKSCHQEKKAEGPAIKDAYHDNCKGCHTKGKKGPTKCEDCHGK